MNEEKKRLIAEIKQKIELLEEKNEDIWLSSKSAAMNEIAIAKLYETLAKLVSDSV